MKRFALATLITLFGASSAQAAVVQLNLNLLLEGPVVSGDQTVTTLLFEDVGLNQVRLTVTSSLNDSDEVISDVSFNVAPSFIPSGITASYVVGSQVGSFTVGSAGDRFNLNDSFQYLLTAPDLDAVDFIVSNGAGHYGYAHVQGIDGGSAGYVATTPALPEVPEPASLLLLGTGLIAGMRWLRKRP